MKRVIFTASCSIFFAAFFLTPLPAAAGSRKFNVQGKLTNAAGLPLSGAQSVTFKLYEASTGGSAIWDSGVLSVTPSTGGLFNVALASGTPDLDTLGFFQPYFLSIKIGADAEMAPRQELGSSPYSFGSSKNFVVRDSLTTSGTLGIVQFGSTAGLTPKLQFYTGVTSTRAYIQADALDLGDMKLQTQGGKPLLLNPEGGHLGIGTTTPTVRLQVQSSSGVADVAEFKSTGTVSRVYLNATAGRKWALESADGALNFVDSSTAATRVNISTFGNVGIGTSNPAGTGLGSTYRTLEVSGPSSGFSNIFMRGPDQSFLTLGRSAGGSNEKWWDFIANSSGLSGRLVNDAYSAATDWLKVTRSTTLVSSVVFPNGKIGIGASSPTSQLHIVGGTSDWTPNVEGIQIGKDGSNYAIEMTNNTGNPYIDFQNDVSGNDYDMRLILNGDDSLGILGGGLGIGTMGPLVSLHVIGSLTVSGSKNFTIGHPLDETKLLVHSAVESPERGLIYRGRAALRNGIAVISLPDYFESLVAPGDRTVQLTCVNGYSPLYVEGELQNGKFTVRTAKGGSASQEFFWMAQGKRGDPEALDEPFNVVIDKPAQDVDQKTFDAMTPKHRGQLKRLYKLRVKSERGER